MCNEGEVDVLRVADGKKGTGGYFSLSCPVVHLVTVLFITTVCMPVFAQPSPAIRSPEVSQDRRITFRFRDPNAKEVAVNIEGIKNPLPMQRDEEDVWSVTTDPFDPDYYGYIFIADGVHQLDPANFLMKPNLLGTQNQVHVPGPAPLPWELNDVPHGVVHHHLYHSRVVGDDRDFYVYTPPNYDDRTKTPYPVLYLLHGYSDEASAWISTGRANVILDNLIAQNKAKPMVVVMPLGYGAPEIVDRMHPSFGNEDLRRRSFEKFRDALLDEVIPAVEHGYRVSKDRNSRALAGLSMGGAETLFVGLNALDHFAWLGAFSSGGLSGDYSKVFPSLDSKANSKLRLLWISCGKDDRLLAPNQELRDWLQSKEIRLQWTETSGAHQWQVWRRNLAAFSSLLFEQK